MSSQKEMFTMVDNNKNVVSLEKTEKLKKKTEIMKIGNEIYEATLINESRFNNIAYNHFDNEGKREYKDTSGNLVVRQLSVENRNNRKYIYDQKDEFIREIVRSLYLSNCINYPNSIIKTNVLTDNNTGNEYQLLHHFPKDLIAINEDDLNVDNVLKMIDALTELVDLGLVYYDLTLKNMFLRKSDDKIVFKKINGFFFIDEIYQKGLLIDSLQKTVESNTCTDKLASILTFLKDHVLFESDTTLEELLDDNVKQKMFREIFNQSNQNDIGIRSFDYFLKQIKTLLKPLDIDDSVFNVKSNFFKKIDKEIVKNFLSNLKKIMENKKIVEEKKGGKRKRKTKRKTKRSTKRRYTRI